MIETSKKIILFVAIIDVVAQNKCILENSWTEWVEQGTCGEVTRTRSYKYYMCEYENS